MKLMRLLKVGLLAALAVGIHAASAQTAPSSCTEVKRRIGQNGRFITHKAMGARLDGVYRELAEIQLFATDSLNSVSEYKITAEGKRGTLSITENTLFCGLNTFDEESFFSSQFRFAITTPDADGRCSVLGTTFSKIVSDKDLKTFVEGGFCTYPIFINPVVSWIMTTAFIPIR